MAQKLRKLEMLGKQNLCILKHQSISHSCKTTISNHSKLNQLTVMDCTL